jgi:V/A-type H+-transporting ATPase subunit D
VAEIKLTKNEMRNQQTHLGQLEKYLPTLQLKKAMLQAEVLEARMEICRLEEIEKEKKKNVEQFAPLLTTKTSIDPLEAIRIKKIEKHYENIAGVEVPYFDSLEFEDFSYNLFETPPWVDAAIVELRELRASTEEIRVAQEKKKALEKELREVSIRVNLFEKILIPRAIENIRTIKVFLGDQELAAVSRAKVAKTKIEKKKESAHA